MTTVRIPVFGAYDTRLGNTAKDQRFKNCFLELIRAPRLDTQSGNQAEGAGDHVFRCVKRPGYSVKHNTEHAAAGRGLYAWKGNLYSVIGNRVFKGTTDLNSAARLSTTTGRVYFTEQHKTDLLVIKAGDEIITVAADDTFTILSDGDIPSGLVAGVVHLDLYIFVMNSDGEIYNSDVDDVANWTAGDFITAKIEPDDGVAIAKWQNYLIALGEWSMELFFDDANASGTPLDPADGTTADTGCAAGATVWSDEDIVIWLGQSKSGGKQLVAFNGNSVKSLSNPAIERILDQEGTNIDQAYGYGMRIAGHLFYVLTLPNTQDITLVCDVHLGTWSEWTSDPGTETYFTGVDHTEADGIHYLLDEDNGRVYEMDFDKYQDAGSTTDNINFEIRTVPHDLGTGKTKFFHRLTLIGDEQTSSSPVTLDWSDDDYQSYSSSVSLDMSTNHPAAYNLGSAKRRAFRLIHTANTPLAIEGIELDVSLGAYTGGNSS